MIDGLKLRMSGDVLKAKLAQRIRALEEDVERHRAEIEANAKGEGDVEEYPMPDRVLENMIDDRLDRIAALTLIYDHVSSAEIYLLDKSDLQFAEMLPTPPEPEWPVCLARR